MRAACLLLLFLAPALHASEGRPPRLPTDSHSVLLLPMEMDLDAAKQRLRKAANSDQEEVALIDGEGAQEQLATARQRGAVLAATAALASTWIEDLDLLADDESPSAGKVGMRPGEAAVWIAGRTLRNLGPGEITLHLPAGASRPERTITLPENRQSDWHELRRAAWARAHDSPRTVGVPEVPRGALVIIGGGGLPREISARFLELGGGTEGKFVVLPTAMDPIPPGDPAAFLKRLGAKHVSVVTARTQAELETPETLALLKEATAVWFGGGRQWRFVDAYEGTKIYDALHDVLARGGVIGGSSAGATIQGEYLVRGAPAGPHIMMCEGYERGFCFLPGTAIDQHFQQRNRFADMTALMKAYPDYLGIGIDEATALVVQGTTAEILGPGKVHMYDRRQATAEEQPDHTSYGRGTRYDLKNRRVLPEPDEGDSATE